MPNQSIVYQFVGNFSNLSAGLATAGRQVGTFGRQLSALDARGERMRRGFDELSGTAGRIGLVAGAGFGAAVMTAANFEQAMSNVAAATHETEANMALLKDAAIDAGASTAFSATEAASAIEELSKAGVSTADILGGGLSGSMDLAAAGGLQVGEAAEIAASALTQFKLAGEDVPHVADLLAAGAGKAQGEVTDLAAALNQSGLVAAQTGLSIEETVGTLSALAAAGLTGSDAGTSFKTMLMSLIPNSEEAAKVMDSLGISAYDAQGNFVGMATFADRLKGALSSMTVEQQNSTLKTIFGSDAVRAASVVFAEGADGITDWTNKVNDAGYAAETATTKLDNLKGDWEGFTGALETALIGSGSGSNGVLRELTQGATALVNGFNAMPPVFQSATGGLLALTALVGGGVWLGGKAVRGIAATRTAFSDLGVSASRAGQQVSATWGPRGVVRDLRTMRNEYANMGRTQALVASGMGQTSAAAQRMSGRLKTVGKTAAGIAGVSLAVSGVADGFGLANTAQMGLMGAAFGPWGAGIGAAAGFAMDLAGGFGESAKEGERAAAAAERLTGLLGTLDTTGAATAETFAGLYSGISEGARESLSALGYSTDALIKDATEGGEASARAIEEIKSRIAELDVNDTLNGGADLEDAMAMGALLEGMETGRTLHDEGAKSAEDHARAEGQVTEAVETEADSMDKLVTSMQAAHNERLKQTGGMRGYEAAIDAAAASLKENGATMDDSTDAGRANGDALDALISSWNGLDGASKRAKGGFEAARNGMIATAESYGMGREAAERYVDAALDVPQRVISQLEATGGDTAVLTAKGYKAFLATVPKDVKTELRAMGVDPAKASVDQLKRAIDNLRDKTVTVTSVTVQVWKNQGAKNRQEVPLPGGYEASADGGTVPKTGLPYADRHHYLLADGEEVISNRFGQADRWRPMLKAINAGRLADGGTAGRPSGAMAAALGGVTLEMPVKSLTSLDTLKEAIKAQTGETRRATAETARLGKLTDRAASKVDGWQSKFDDLAGAVSDKYKSELFGQDTSSTSPFLQQGSANSAATVLNTLRGDNANYEAQIRLQAKAKRLGIDDKAFAELASEASIPELRALLNQDGFAEKYQKLYDRREALGEKAGKQAGDAAWGKELAYAKEQLDIARRNEKAAIRRERAEERRGKQLDRQMTRIEKAIAADKAKAARGRKNRRPR